MQDLYSFLNPKSIAVIGASNKEGKIGNILVRNLKEFGFGGQVFPINPKINDVLGYRCFSKITEIEQEIDLVLVAVPASLVCEVIDGATGRSSNFVVISAGFSETGQEGQEMEKKLAKLAKDREINILGPNCLGFLNPELNLNASFASGLPESGGVAFLSQSGALAVAVLDQAREKKIGFSKIVSLGNKMQIGENEILNFLKEDEKTKAVGLYLESFEKGPEFLQIVSDISKEKPVVVLKAGKSQQAKEAMLSHTGSLSGESKIAKAALEISNVIETETIQEFMDVMNLFAKDKKTEKNKAVIVTNAGGPGVLATDLFENKEIKLFKISEKTKEELKDFLPEASSLKNPVDLLGDALSDRYQKALEVLDKENDLGIIFCLVTPQEQTPVEEIARLLVKFSLESDKIVVPVFIGGEKVKKAKEFLNEAGLLTFNYPGNAIEAINKYFVWKNKTKEKIEALEANLERQKEAQVILKKVKGEKRKVFNVFESEELLNLYEIPNSPVWGALGNGFQFPLVLKVDSEKHLHKTEENGVILNIKNQQELDQEIEIMKQKFPNAGLIVQKQEKKGEEIILGIKKDISFGPVVAYGLGGIFTEVFQKVDFVFPGMNKEQIKKAVKKSSIGFMFQEFRGRNPLDLDVFSEIILNLLNLALEISEIKEMDINPMLGFREDGNFKAVDTKILI